MSRNDFRFPSSELFGQTVVVRLLMLEADFLPFDARNDSDRIIERSKSNTHTHTVLKSSSMPQSCSYFYVVRTAIVSIEIVVLLLLLLLALLLQVLLPSRLGWLLIKFLDFHSVILRCGGTP